MNTQLPDGLNGTIFLTNKPGISHSTSGMLNPKVIQTHKP